MKKLFPLFAVVAAVLLAAGCQVPPSQSPSGDDGSGGGKTNGPSLSTVAATDGRTVSVSFDEEVKVLNKDGIHVATSSSKSDLVGGADTVQKHKVESAWVDGKKVYVTLKEPVKSREYLSISVDPGAVEGLRSRKRNPEKVGRVKEDIIPSKAPEVAKMELSSDRKTVFVYFSEIVKIKNPEKYKDKDIDLTDLVFGDSAGAFGSPPDGSSRLFGILKRVVLVTSRNAESYGLDPSLAFYVLALEFNIEMPEMNPESIDLGKADLSDHSDDSNAVEKIGLDKDKIKPGKGTKPTDSTAPSITKIDILTKSSGVNGRIALKFSEPIDESTIRKEKITVADNTSSTKFLEIESVIRTAPTQVEIALKEYILRDILVKVDAGAFTDLAGNGIGPRLFRVSYDESRYDYNNPKDGPAIAAIEADNGLFAGDAEKTLKIRFNQEIEPNRSNPAHYDMKDVTVEVIGTNGSDTGSKVTAVAYAPSDALEVTMDKHFVVGQEIKVTIPAGKIKSRVTGKVNVEISFTDTVRDTTMPEVTQVVLSSGSDKIELAYNKPIASAHKDRYRVMDVTGGAKKNLTIASAAANGNRVVLTLPAALTDNRNIEVWSGPGAARDAAGNKSFAGNFKAYTTTSKMQNAAPVFTAVKALAGSYRIELTFDDIIIAGFDKTKMRIFVADDAEGTNQVEKYLNWHGIRRVWKSPGYEYQVLVKLTEKVPADRHLIVNLEEGAVTSTYGKKNQAKKLSIKVDRNHVRLESVSASTRNNGTARLTFSQEIATVDRWGIDVDRSLRRRARVKTTAATIDPEDKKTVVVTFQYSLYNDVPRSEADNRIIVTVAEGAVVNAEGNANNRPLEKEATPELSIKFDAAKMLDSKTVALTFSEQILNNNLTPIANKKFVIKSGAGEPTTVHEVTSSRNSGVLYSEPTSGDVYLTLNTAVKKGDTVSVEVKGMAVSGWLYYFGKTMPGLEIKNSFYERNTNAAGVKTFTADW